MVPSMKLTLQLQLLPSAEQKALLLQTMERFNEAASYAAGVGFATKVFSQATLHKRSYRELRKRFGLSAQMAVRAIGKAVEVFKRDKSKRPVFRPHGAVTYDQRILGFKGPAKVSLWTLSGREVVSMVYGEYQRERFDRIKGQCDLVYRDGRFYLLATIDLPEGAPVEAKDFLGVDLGVVHLATDSDGNAYSGEAVEKVRQRHHRHKKRLQPLQTRGAKKLLRRLAGQESRFRRHQNHVISKKLVALAKDTARGIALEDLHGIRECARFRKAQRAQISGWAFDQLRLFVGYKAKLSGVSVVMVDARHTSQTCSVCGHCERGNRRTQARFECLHCSYSSNADHNGARNIRARAACRPALELASLVA
jgi:putative transposase